MPERCAPRPLQSAIRAPSLPCHRPRSNVGPASGRARLPSSDPSIMRLRLAALLTAPSRSPCPPSMPRPRSNRWIRCATSSRPTRPGRCSTSRCRASRAGRFRHGAAGRLHGGLPAAAACARPARRPAGGWPAPALAAARARLRRRGLPGGLGRSGGAVGQVFAQRMRGLVRQRRRSEVRVVRRVRNRGGWRAHAGRAHRNPGVRTD